MILTGKIKEETLYKLDRLLREVIIETYLLQGNTGEGLNQIDEHVCEITNVANKVHNNEDVSMEDLKFMDTQFRMYQPMTGSLDGELKVEFDFKGEE